MSRSTTRKTMTLSKEELATLEMLKEHFDSSSFSDTVRRTISQSSLLKRYADELGEVIIEKNGKKYILDSKR